MPTQFNPSRGLRAKELDTLKGALMTPPVEVSFTELFFDLAIVSSTARLSEYAGEALARSSAPRWEYEIGCASCFQRRSAKTMPFARRAPLLLAPVSYIITTHF